MTATRSAPRCAPVGSCVLLLALTACNGSAPKLAGETLQSADAAIDAAPGKCATDGGWGPMEPRFCSPNGAGPTRSPLAPNSLFGRVLALEPDQLGEACSGLEGVEVCLLSSDNCTTSDTDGTFVLEGLPTGQLEITFAKEGYLSILHQRVLGSSPLIVNGPHLLRTEAFERFVACAGDRMDPSLGHLNAVVASQSSPRGVSIALDPLSGSGPHYLVGGTGPRLLGLNPTLTATDEGHALWFDVEPGDYELHYTLEATGADLTPFCLAIGQPGWPPMGNGALRVRIRAGFLTTGVAYCVVPGN